MKKNLLILIMLSVVLYSCGNSFGGFDPRAYNSKPPLVTEDQEDSDSGDIVIPDDDPFDDHQNANVGFDASVFDTWNLRIKSINGSNVPDYVFEDTGILWNRSNDDKDPTKNEYSHIGQDFKVDSIMTVTMSRVKYYRYKSINPMYGGDNPNYNMGAHGERMERFYFYKFYAYNNMAPPLNNFIIAIDTYTKLIFAYAVPTSHGTTAGIPYPKTWGPVDTETTGPNDLEFKFYEYDPIGIVHSDGKVEVYQWFKNVLGSGSVYAHPRIDTSTHDITEQDNRAIAEANKPGRSPYFYLAGDIDVFLDEVKDKTFSLRDTDPNTIEDTLTLNTYKFSADGKTLEHNKTEWFGEGTPTVVTTFSDYNKVNGTSGKYDGITFKLENETKLYKGNTHIGTLGYNQEPDFLDRVKGANFGSGADWKFIDNGKSVVINGSEYNFEYQNDDDPSKALYWWKNGIGVYYFYVFDLSNGDIKDKIIHRSKGFSTKDDPMWYGSLGWIEKGVRDVPPPPPSEDLFLMNVATRTYSLRDTANSMVLHKYKFSSDGKIVTHNTKLWTSSGDNFIKNYTGYRRGNDTSGDYSGILFEVRGNDLYKNSVHVGTYNYNDPGVDELIVTVTAKKLNNINWGSTAGKMFGGINYLNYGGFSHSVRAAVYVEGEANKNYRVLHHLKDGKQVAGDSSTWNIKKGEYLSLSGSASGTYYDNESDIIIELDAIIRLHNFMFGIEGARGTKNSETSAVHGHPIVTLKYNENTGSVTVDGVTGGGVSAVYDQGFTVQTGEAKDFTITYGTGDKQTSITYNIKVD